MTGPRRREEEISSAAAWPWPPRGRWPGLDARLSGTLAASAGGTSLALAGAVLRSAACRSRNVDEKKGDICRQSGGGQ